MSLLKCLPFARAPTTLSQRRVSELLNLTPVRKNFVNNVGKIVTELRSHLIQLINANPFTWILSGYRNALYEGRSPEWAPLGLLALASIPAIFLSIYLFRRASPLFVKVL